MTRCYRYYITDGFAMLSSPQEAHDALKRSHNDTYRVHQTRLKPWDHLRRLRYYWPNMIEILLLIPTVSCLLAPFRFYLSNSTIFASYHGLMVVWNKTLLGWLTKPLSKLDFVKNCRMSCSQTLWFDRVYWKGNYYIIFIKDNHKIVRDMNKQQLLW